MNSPTSNGSPNPSATTEPQFHEAKCAELKREKSAAPTGDWLKSLVSTYGVAVLMIALAFVPAFVLTGCEWGSIGYNRGYAPDQPIHFSHELHAGQYKIQCLYCHSTAERAAHSAVPSLNICMNCHLVVATDKPAIQQISEAYNNNKPIVWNKVHLLPDFVKFNHAAHVAKFGAPQACHKCHGPVESMEKMYQYSSLSMGWCVNCHRQPENKAPVSCSTCHY